MIRIENTVVPHGEQWKSLILGARNPMNSWDRSDSEFVKENCEDCFFKSDYSVCKHNPIHKCFDFDIGSNDLDLMTRLSKAGTDHRKFMRMIVVYADIIAPLYWWSEYDTYKVGTVANSCSKMHTLLERPFEMSDFSFDKLSGYKREIKYFIPEIDESSEEWTQTKQDEFYEVSNLGRVRHDGRILSGSIQSDGYIRVNIRGKSYPKHRVVAEAFIDNPENKPFVNHIDGNKQNNQVDNLEWCTQSENVKHAYENNIAPKGLSTYKGKFTDEQREDIKRCYDTGLFSRRQLAEKYNVSHTCINDIINDKYKYSAKVNLYENVARPLVDTLNELRDSYLRCEDMNDKKKIWYSIIQLLPQSYNQKRTVMLNYEVLKNMYHSRKAHKLTEWQEFCSWIENLPYSELITGE